MVRRKKIMYKTDDVAQYIINYSSDNGIIVTNLKLQILMYYIQAYFISEKNHVLFENEFLKYLFGPAIDSVYHTYQHYTNQPIDRQNYSKKIVLENGLLRLKKVEFSYSDFKLDDRIMMSTVIECMRKYDPWELVPYVKEEDPWKSAIKSRDVMTVESIRNFFRPEINRKRIFGVFDDRRNCDGFI